MDILQDKIRKRKNPTILELNLSPQDIPRRFLSEQKNPVEAVGDCCMELLCGRKGVITAVRFGYGWFALMGTEGLVQLQRLLRKASDLGYYVLLNAPEIFSVDASKYTAEALLGEEGVFPCDGLVVSGYLGSDVIKAFLPLCKSRKKDVFLVGRTANKSAPEIQDLLSGSRLVHAAAADYANRIGAGTAGKSGYNHIGFLAAATAANSLKSLREKYPGLFLLVDGYDYPGANAKNCSYAFDKYGHGAVVCAGRSISCAWNQAEAGDLVGNAVAAAERMKKNLNNYITVL